MRADSGAGRWRGGKPNGRGTMKRVLLAAGGPMGRLRIEAPAFQ